MENKNIRVVIAEDEPPTGRFLKRLVEQTAGFEVVAVCLNGETAAEAVRELKADLIISDIRMSGMDGLELIAAIKEEFGEIHAILVTGYKMFEYAREAVSLKIDAFITKPVNQKELGNALCTIREKHKQALTGELRADLENILRNGGETEFRREIPFAKIRLLIIYYSGEKKEIAGVLKGMKGGLLYVYYKEAVIVFEDAGSADSVLEKAARKILCMKTEKKTRVVVQVKEVPSQGDFIARLRRFYRGTVRRLAVPGKTRHAVYPDFQQISHEYKEDTRVLRQTEIAVMAKDYNGIRENLPHLFEDWKENNVSVFHMRRQIHAVSAMMERAGILAWDKVSLNDQMDELLVCTDSYDEIREAILKCWMDSLVTKDGNRDRRDCRIFEEIEGFIEQNRSCNYSLQEISSIFKVSQPYIRKVFRQYTGKSYNEYVLEKKLAYAVELLETNPDIYVKEIADMLGYEQLYFGTVFKKAMGVSPSQYRAALSERRK